MIPKHHRQNLETLQQAFANDQVALLEVQEASTGVTRTALAAVSLDEGEYAFTPFALMIDGNPYELFRPPNPEGGFHNG